MRSKYPIIKFLWWYVKVLFTLVFLPVLAIIAKINKTINDNLEKLGNLILDIIIFSVTILSPYALLKNVFFYFFYLKYIYIYLMFTLSLINTIINMFNYQTFCLIAFVGSFLINLAITVILFLMFTVFAATVTLNERKLLSLVQRRVGPDHVGYKGRLQYIADAIKLILKHIFIINNNTTNRLFFLLIPALLLIIGYLSWVNLLWSWNLTLIEIENNLLLMNILSGIFTYLMVLVGYVSNNKYSIYSSNRVLLVTVNLEIYLSFFILFILLYSQSFSFEFAVMKQMQIKWAAWCFLVILPFFLLVFLLETGRIPFDYMEAESELIAGVTIEYSGFYFALFYLNEYFHLITFSGVYVTCLLGGWV